MHLCIFAVFGSTLRITLGRIFGHDCEFPQAVNDFISHLSTCVTASGTTRQRGGTLFFDLPANVLGSFFLGILTLMNQDVPPIPWLRPGHELQGDAGMHSGIQVAFCRSLTTFASWNTQMIVMVVERGAFLVAAQALIFCLEEEEEDKMMRLMLMALKTGLAGNILTVSSFLLKQLVGI